MIDKAMLIVYSQPTRGKGPIHGPEGVGNGLSRGKGCENQVESVLFSKTEGFTKKEHSSA